MNESKIEIDQVAGRDSRKIPLELLAFLVFSIIATLLQGWWQFVATAAEREPLIKYFGWTASTPYTFSLIGGTMLCVQRRLNTRNLLVGLLIVWALGQLIQFMFDRNHGDSENPYLMVSPYRPIWTVLIPLLWGAVLMSPRVTSYCVRVHDPERVATATGGG